MRGCIEVSEVLPEVAPEVEAPAETTENEQVDDGEFRRLLNDALTKILVRNDPDDFKVDGMPKVNKVVAEMPLEAPRPTATEISDAYSELQEDISLAE